MAAPGARRTGEAIALREVWNGRVWSARPATVVRDGDAPRIFFTPAGSPWMAPTGPDGTRLRLPQDDWTLEPAILTDTHVLSFAWPDRRYAILLMWDPGWDLLHWYVNVEEPARPTSVGFDFKDLVLDAVIAPDLSSWSWKDEDELAEAIRRGIHPQAEARRFREAAERGVEHVRSRRPPFDADWPAWRPDPAWPTPELPPGWELLE